MHSFHDSQRSKVCQWEAATWKRDTLVPLTHWLEGTLAR